MRVGGFDDPVLNMLGHIKDALVAEVSFSPTSKTDSFISPTAPFVSLLIIRRLRRGRGVGRGSWIGPGFVRGPSSISCLSSAFFFLDLEDGEGRSSENALDLGKVRFIRGGEERGFDTEEGVMKIVEKEVPDFIFLHIDTEILQNLSSLHHIMDIDGERFRRVMLN